MEEYPHAHDLDRPFKVGRLLFNADSYVQAFIHDHMESGFNLDGDIRTVGVLDNDDMLICGVCWHDFLGSGAMMSGAASRPGRWTTRSVMAGIFAYAFDSLDLHRVTCLVSENNQPSLRWCMKAGFKEEGRLREAAVDHTDLLVLGLLKQECGWIDGKQGRRRTKGTEREEDSAIAV